jgi:hypothetical protein
MEAVFLRVTMRCSLRSPRFARKLPPPPGFTTNYELDGAAPSPSAATRSRSVSRA